jgi:hypothetical protein
MLKAPLNISGLKTATMICDNTNTKKNHKPGERGFIFSLPVNKLAIKRGTKVNMSNDDSVMELVPTLKIGGSPKMGSIE